jgi:hypothetical protein
MSIFLPFKEMMAMPCPINGAKELAHGYPPTDNGIVGDKC